MAETVNFNYMFYPNKHRSKEHKWLQPWKTTPTVRPFVSTLWILGQTPSAAAPTGTSVCPLLLCGSFCFPSAILVSCLLLLSTCYLSDDSKLPRRGPQFPADPAVCAWSSNSIASYLPPSSTLWVSVSRAIAWPHALIAKLPRDPESQSHAQIWTCFLALEKWK